MAGRSTKLIGGLMIVAIILSGLWVAPTQAQTAGFAVGQQVTPTYDLNLRSGAAASFPAVAVIRRGEIATVTGAASFGWYPVSYTGLDGWAAGQFLLAANASPTLSTPTPVNVGQPQATSTPVNVGQPQPTSTPVNVGQPSNTPVASPTTTNPDDIWLGVMNNYGNIRLAPTLTAPITKTWPLGRKVMIYATVTGDPINGNSQWYLVGTPPDRERDFYVHSSLVDRIEPVALPLPQNRLKGRWIDVNISQQTLIAFEDDRPVMYTLVSTGTDKFPTELGRWKIYWRLEKQTMENRAVDTFSPDYYRLEDVPYPQYFHNSGEALHGTFWHDNFGTPRSHGCVNMTIPASEWIYKNFASIGTVVIVHN